MHALREFCESVSIHKRWWTNRTNFSALQALTNNFNIPTTEGPHNIMAEI